MLTSRARMRTRTRWPSAWPPSRTHRRPPAKVDARQVPVRRRARRPRRRAPRRRLRRGGSAGRGARAFRSSGPCATRAAAFHHHEVVGQPRHFVGRVADVEHGDLQFVVQAFEVGQDFVLAREVERGQRLVHQQQARAGEQRAGDGDALALAAREAVRLRSSRWPMPSSSMAWSQRDAALRRRHALHARSRGCRARVRCGNRLASWNT